MQVKKSKADQSAATRGLLIATARRLFGKKGYAETGTEEIVEAAKITRGALYHHFADKSALFEAVVEDVARDILDRIEEAAAESSNALEAIIAGSGAYIDICLVPAISRIYVIDAPAVLGPTRLREIDARYAAGSLREGIEALLKDRPRLDVSADALTALISGALDEAVLWLVHHNDTKARRRLDKTLEVFLRGLWLDA